MRGASSPEVARSVARLSGLLFAAVLVVHQVRYRLAFGDQTAGKLEHTGHGYLTAFVPFCGLALAVGVSWCLLQAAAGPAQGTGHRSMSRRRFWLLASAALLAVFTGQELVEGWTSPGHPGGLTVLVGPGGWMVVPLALALGGVVTLLAGVVERAERTISRARWSRRPRGVSWGPVERPRVLVEGTMLCASEPLARHLAGRGPPAMLRTR